MIHALSMLAAVNPGCPADGGACTGDASLHISVEYRSILPILVLAIGALVLLLVSALLPKRSWPGLYAGLTVVIGALATAAGVWQWYDLGNSAGSVTIGGQVFYDHFGVFFMILVAIAVILAALTSDSYLRQEGLEGVEAYVLMLISATGAMLMAVSGGLIMLFLGLEIMSIALYVMAAYHRRRAQSGEAGLKYFILGSFSSAIFLYGVALIYGSTGSTQFTSIAQFLATNILTHNGVLLGGLSLLIVGLGFKVAAVPFHFWTPDVYQGSPTPFTGYMAAVAKAAGFAGLLRVLTQALSTQEVNWRPIIWFIAVLTLIVGSVLALAQKDLKRMFAYSSISQAGYVLVGVQAASAAGTAGALFYLFTYAFIIVGTFAVVGLLEGRGEARTDLGVMRGLASRRPWLAVVMLVFLLAQAGVPFTSGFLAKFYVIDASVQRGQYPLAVIAMLAAAIAAFFYLRVALLMYAPASEEPAGGSVSSGSLPAGGSVSSGSLPAEALASSGSSSPVPGASPESLGPLAALEGPSVPVQTVVDQTTSAGLQPVPSLDGANATATLADPPTGRITEPWPVVVALALCAAFTVFAGVTPVVIDFARSATTLF
jgi:NADH-quinone oxidoreductase subunit N